MCKSRIQQTPPGRRGRTSIVHSVPMPANKFPINKWLPSTGSYCQIDKAAAYCT